METTNSSFFFSRSRPAGAREQAINKVATLEPKSSSVGRVVGLRGESLILREGGGSTRASFFFGCLLGGRVTVEKNPTCRGGAQRLARD